MVAAAVAFVGGKLMLATSNVRFHGVVLLGQDQEDSCWSASRRKLLSLVSWWLGPRRRDDCTTLGAARMCNCSNQCSDRHWHVRFRRYRSMPPPRLTPLSNSRAYDNQAEEEANAPVILLCAKKGDLWPPTSMSDDDGSWSV